MTSKKKTDAVKEAEDQIEIYSVERAQFLMAARDRGIKIDKCKAQIASTCEVADKFKMRNSMDTP